MLPTDSAYGGWAARYFELFLFSSRSKHWTKIPLEICSGEIDIMEYRGQESNKVMGTLHYSSEWPNNRYRGSGAITFPFDFSADYHVFALEWERDTMRWYVDGQKYYEMTLDRNWVLLVTFKRNF
jgi:beta-glucanase (GH16 family)